MSTEQDPTHVIAHFLGFLPGKNRVMCLVHGGKSIPWNVSLREPCGTGKRVFPFSSKRLLLLRLWEGQRSDVPSAHSPQHTKPTADVATPSRNPQGSSGNNWLHRQLHNSSCAQSAKTQMHVCFRLSQGKSLTIYGFDIFIQKCDTRQQMRQPKCASVQGGQDVSRDILAWLLCTVCMCFFLFNASLLQLFSLSCCLGLMSSHVLFLT